MKKDKKNYMMLLGVAAILLLVVLINPPILSLLGTSYVTIGDYTDVKVGSTVDIGAKVNSYNSLIAQSNKVVSGIDKYQDCKLTIDAIDYFSQSGTYYVRIKEGSHYIMTAVNQGDATYTCDSGGTVAMKITPKSCTTATNPDPQAYTNYQTCPALARIEFGIRTTAITTIECQTGDVKTKTCWDDSEIVVTQCVDNLWKRTGTTCPDQPPTTEPAPTTPSTIPTTEPAPATPIDYEIPEDAVYLPEKEYIFGIERDYWIVGLSLVIIVAAGLIYTKKR